MSEIPASLIAALEGYTFSHVEDYGKTSGKCDEGHNIRYGYVFIHPTSGKKIILGGTCQWKVYVYRKWRNINVEDIDQEMLEIGEMFWKIEKSGHWNEVMNSPGAPSMDKVPSANDRRWVKTWLRGTLSRITREEKNRIKEKLKAQMNMDAKFNKEQKIQARIKFKSEHDKDLIDLKSMTFNDESDEKVRLSLIESYVKSLEGNYSDGWTDKQRKLARYLMAKHRGLSESFDERVAHVKKMAKYVAERVRNDHIVNFLRFVANSKILDEITLTEKQEKYLADLLERNLKGTHLWPAWDLREFLRKRVGRK